MSIVDSFYRNYDAAVARRREAEDRREQQRQRARAQADEQTARNATAAMAAGNVEGARKAASGLGSPQAVAAVNQYFQGLDEQRRAGILRQNEGVQRMAFALRAVPPDRRGPGTPAHQAAMGVLREHGFDDQEAQQVLSATDDERLDAYMAAARSIDEWRERSAVREDGGVLYQLTPGGQVETLGRRGPNVQEGINQQNANTQAQSAQASQTRAQATTEAATARLGLDRERLEMQRERLELDRARQDQAAPSLRGSATEQAATLRRTDEARTTRGDASAALAAVSEFVELNRRTATGPLADVRALASTDLQRMRSITERLTPQVRAAGSGAMSDADVAMYRRSVVNIQTGRDANAQTAAAMAAGFQAQIDHADFVTAYIERHGTAVGADALWARYSEAHPIYDHQTGAPRQRPPWRSVINIEARQTGATASPPAAQSGGVRLRQGGNGRPVDRGQ